MLKIMGMKYLQFYAEIFCAYTYYNIHGYASKGPHYKTLVFIVFGLRKEMGYTGSNSGKEIVLKF